MRKGTAGDGCFDRERKRKKMESWERKEEERDDAYMNEQRENINS